MKIFARKWLVGGGLGFALLLSACEAPDYSHKEPLNPSFGNAVKHNFSLQVIDPTPVASDEPPMMDGARAGRAMSRYRSGSQTQATSPLTGGGASGGATGGTGN
jgi:hypothetical protein